MDDPRRESPDKRPAVNNIPRLGLPFGVAFVLALSKGLGKRWVELRELHTSEVIARHSGLFSHHCK